MRIGIIVYSATENTLSVTELVRDRLAAEGRAVKLERIEPCVERVSGFVTA